MKKRNKKWLLLAAILALFGGSMNSVAALAIHQAGLLNGGLEVTRDLTVLGDNENDTTWDINRVDSAIDALDINGADGKLYFSLFIEQTWVMETALIVYRDYENGVTEETADREAQTLGEDAASWAVTVSEYKPLNGVQSGVYIQMDFPSKTLMSDNLTNEFYYALKIAKQDNPTEYYWKRGKLSYRRCAKTPGFDDKMMQCSMPMKNGYYVPTLKKHYLYGGQTLPMIDEDQIEDWDTEWRKVLLGRYQQVTELLQNTDKYLKNFVSHMTSAQKTLEGLKKTQDSVDGIEEITDNLVERTQQWQDLEDYYAGLLGSGSSDNNTQELQTQLAELKAANQELLAQNGVLVKEKEVLAQQNRELAEQNKTLLAQNETLATQNGTLLAQNQDLQAKNADLTDEKTNLTNQVAELTAEIERLKALNVGEEYVSELEALKLTNQELLAKIKKLETTNTAFEAEKREIESQFNELLSQYNELKASFPDCTQCVTADLSSITGTIANGGNSAQNSDGPNQSSQELDNSVTTIVPYNNIQSAAQDDKFTEEQEVSVPKLGGNSLNVWLGIALLALALGIVMLWLKRVINR